MKFIGSYWLCALLSLAVISFLTMSRSQAQEQGLSFYDTSYVNAQKPPGTLIKAEKVRLPPLYRAAAWRILYSTRDYKGRPLVGSAVVIVSGVRRAPAGGRKVIAWAHPTAGTNRSCAPSLQSNYLSSIAGVNEFVGLGYAIVAPDYPGLGTVGPIGYLVGKGQAYAIFDAVRAARQINEQLLGPDLALFGYSQGGHAVLAASLVADTYAPEFDIKGVVAIAPPTDLRKLMLMDLGTVEGRILMAYTLQSWAVKYGLSLRALIESNSLATVLEINRVCTTRLEDKIKLFRKQEALGRNYLRADPATVEGWGNVIKDNSIRILPIGQPFLILQGDTDSVVRPQVTLAAVQSSCRMGANVRLQMLQGKGHGEALNAGKITAVNWIAERFSNVPAKSNCH